VAVTVVVGVAPVAVAIVPFGVDVSMPVPTQHSINRSSCVDAHVTVYVPVPAAGAVFTQSDIRENAPKFRYDPTCVHPEVEPFQLIGVAARFAGVPAPLIATTYITAPDGTVMLLLVNVVDVAASSYLMSLVE
jgi:hypothetical protein